MSKSYVIGVDSGGSHTRAVCVALDGTLLGWARASGGSPTHSDDAQEQFRSAIVAAIADAGRELDGAVGLAAGMAGLDDDKDAGWASRFVDLEGLDCPKLTVNDSEVAHAGAFVGGPGILVVAGTGSIIFGITEMGEYVRNYSYHHYGGAARHLAFDAMARILIGEDSAGDADFVAGVLDAWGVVDRHALHAAVVDHAGQPNNDVKRSYGKLAILVTAAAEHSPLASDCVARSATANSVGVRLLATRFATESVRVALVGGLATSAAFTSRIATTLDEASEGRIQIVTPMLPPTAGAAFLALQRSGQFIDDALIDRLAVTSRHEGAC